MFLNCIGTTLRKCTYSKYGSNIRLNIAKYFLFDNLNFQTVIRLSSNITYMILIDDTLDTKIKVSITPNDEVLPALEIISEFRKYIKMH